MQRHISTFDGFGPNEDAFHTLSFQVNKEQFNEMMMNIYDESMFHGKKPFIIGILSSISFITIYKFAYHTGWGQIALVICFIGALFGILLGAMFYFPSSSFKKQVKKDYLNTDMSSLFTYNFYREGIEVISPIMNGRFEWQDIYMGTVEPTSTIFGFSKATPNGKAIYKKYKNSYLGVVVPFMFLDNKQEFIDLLKALSQANILRMTFHKSLRD